MARVRDRQARPGRRAHRPQAQAVGHRVPQGARHDERGDPRRVPRYESIAGTSRRTPSSPRRRRSRTSTASSVRASRSPPRPPARSSTTSTSTQALRPGEGGPLQAQPQASHRRAAKDSVLTLEDIHRDDQVPVALHAEQSNPRGVRTASRSRSVSTSTTSTTSATVASARSPSSSRTRSAPASRAWSASCASA